MEAAVVNCFIEGTFHILDTTASVKVKPEKPYIKKNEVSKGVITGLLDIEGDINGTAAISFTEKSILGIVSTMFGEDMPEINEEITDAVGEIGNMISGHVNTKMTEMGKSVKVKLAGVKEGEKHAVGHSPGKKIVVFPFHTNRGDIWIEVCY
ncbi:CheC domain protein [Desulfamplus magnetovallimortis]|uniref:CheC domain protein n=1 Tax=Desulfamplus magnetovallimortis TaxID=1246637 RepID=A0A1W1HKL3_9BACT|nr:chemotaxis protein CheX [Desulfamplus magnetovallimortis]SLM32955.1 CheC domain protein [Desulfamplus magnetovallimortis]